jgi:hypothetical protein
VREQLRKRLSEQEEKERATKTELVQKAASYLEQFYEVNSHAAVQPNQTVHQYQTEWCYRIWFRVVVSRRRLSLGDM